jgi:hypothetical protein
MVRYTGRAKTRTGSVNTNQLGLKMSGCTSRIGRTMVPMKLVPSRVDCMAGVCKPIRYHGVLWGRGGLRNQPPYCRRQATRCQAAAGGVGTKHNIPYYRIPKRGESGCTPAPPFRAGSSSSSSSIATGSLLLDVGAATDAPSTGYLPPEWGALSSIDYKGPNIDALFTENQGGPECGGAPKFQFYLTMSGVCPSVGRDTFSCLQLSGGSIPGVLSFNSAAALSFAGDDSDWFWEWCYPGGTSWTPTTPPCDQCPTASPGLVFGEKITVTFS